MVAFVVVVVTGLEVPVASALAQYWLWYAITVLATAVPHAPFEQSRMPKPKLTLPHMHDGSGLEHPRDEYEAITLLKHVCPQDGRELMAGSVVVVVVEVFVALVDTGLDDVDEVSRPDEDLLVVVIDTLLEVTDADEVSKTVEYLLDALEDLLLVREVVEVTLLQSPQSFWLHLWISGRTCIYSGLSAVTYHPTPQSATEEPHMPSLLQQNP